MISGLSEHTKHAVDVTTAVAPIAAGTAAAITLNNVALIMTILAAACSIAWFIIRLCDRLRYGPSAGGE